MEEISKTAAAKWRTAGEDYSFGDRYECERHELPLGDLTDDELANAVFMLGDSKPTMQEVIAGTAKLPVVYLTAGQNRIRWLSRENEKKAERIRELEKIEQECKELREWKGKAKKLSKTIVEPALTLACQDYAACVGPEGNRSDWERFIYEVEGE